MVAEIVKYHVEDIRRMCERYRVRRLDLFGSGAAADFDPLRSDLDFLVEFPRLAPKDHADAYFGLFKALCELFRRDIDLVEMEGVSNPYVRAAIERTRVPVYHVDA